MDRQSCAKNIVWVMGLILLLSTGCERTSAKQGMDIMFDGRANIAQPEVYFAHKVVGEIITLLSDRVYRASLRAERLYRRFI